MLADIRDALRQLRKSPGFTATAVITLALGIGATTAIFTLVHQVMLKSLPVTNPEELWRIGDKIRCCNWGGYTQGSDGDFSLFSWEMYKNFRKNTPEFSDLAALQSGSTGLAMRRSGSQAPVELRNGQYVSGNFFRTFGIQPWIGRLMTDADDQEGATPVAVMSYHVWKEKYNSDPSVVGASYQINGYAFTIIGVTPPGFYGAKLADWGMPDLWLPITSEILLDSPRSTLKGPATNMFDLIGRVRPGTNPSVLEAKLRVEFHDWLAGHVPDMQPTEKEEWQKQTLHLAPGGSGVSELKEAYQDGLHLLLAASACVLLVACCNLANLMLVRGLKNRAQTSIRMALGASRRKLVRRALVESTVLAVLGGAVGISVAYGGSMLIMRLAFDTARNHNHIPVQASPSLPVLFFTLGISVLTGVLFGIAPAWVTSHSDPVEALRGSSRAVRGGRSWVQKSLVIGQAAMSLVLISAAALLSQSLRNLEHQDFGFESKGRYLVRMNSRLANYQPEQLDLLYKQLEARILEIPGVKSMGSTLYAPMAGNNWSERIRVAGHPEPSAKQDGGSSWARVTPGFFPTMGVKIQKGRVLTEEDTATTRKVAVVNEAFVKRFLKGEDPIGKHFGINRVQYSSTYEIVGVIRDLRYSVGGYKEPIAPFFLVPESQATKYGDEAYTKGDESSHYLSNLVLWAPGDPPGLAESVRKAVASVNPDLVLYTVDSYSEVLGNDFEQERMLATLTMLFGALGLVLAAVGLYGVTAYGVEQRTGEIGVRMALGADRREVIRMVLRGAFSQIGIGLALGIPAAIGAGRLIAEQLYGVSPWNPLMLSMATLIIGMAALLASIIPASRAASIEPMQALRME